MYCSLMWRRPGSGSSQTGQPPNLPQVMGIWLSLTSHQGPVPKSPSPIQDFQDCQSSSNLTCPFCNFHVGPYVGEGTAYLSKFIITFPIFLPASSSPHRPTPCWDSSFWCTRMKLSSRGGSFVVVVPQSVRPGRVLTAWRSGAPASCEHTSLLYHLGNDVFCT